MIPGILSNSDTLRMPAECMVTIDNQEIVDLYSYIQEVTVDMKRGAATVCTIVFYTIRTETGEWLIQDDDRMEPWRKLAITAYFGNYHEEVMRGYIKEVKIDYPQEKGSAKVTVIGQDESFLLDREHAKDSWSKGDISLRDGDIASRIARDHQLIPQVESGLENVAVNGDDTYINFLRKRAEANGFELFTRNGMLHFHLPDLGGVPQATIMVYAGRLTNCLSFNAHYDGHKPDTISVVRAAETGTQKTEIKLSPGLRSLGQKPTTSDDKGLSKPFTWYIRQPTGATQEEANSRAQAKINELAWKVSAEGELDGALYGHVLLNYNTVNVDGVGNTYDGTYYVADVRHSFTHEGYRQTFKLIRNAIGETTQPATVDVLSGVRL